MTRLEIEPRSNQPENLIIKEVNKYGNELAELSLAKKQTNGSWLGLLETRIIDLVKVHEATDQEIDNVYNHILMEILK